jgi:hypothetical protein
VMAKHPRSQQLLQPNAEAQQKKVQGVKK